MFDNGTCGTYILSAMDEKDEDVLREIEAMSAQRFRSPESLRTSLPPPRRREYRSQVRILHNHLWVARMAARMTQEELARRVGVQRKTVHTIETGKSVPSVIVALKLARELNRPMEALFKLVDRR